MDPKTVSKPALTAAGAAALWKAYDTNNNAAIKAASAPTYNAKGWDAVDTDAVLLADRYETARNRLARDATKPATLKHAPVAVFAPSARTYPIVAIVAASVGSSTPKVGTDAKAVMLSVMRKDSVAAPWLMAATTAAPKAGLPAAPGNPARALRRRPISNGRVSWWLPWVPMSRWAPRPE